MHQVRDVPMEAGLRDQQIHALTTLILHLQTLGTEITNGKAERNLLVCLTKTVSGPPFGERVCGEIHRRNICGT